MVSNLRDSDSPLRSLALKPCTKLQGMTTYNPMPLQQLCSDKIVENMRSYLNMLSDIPESLVDGLMREVIEANKLSDHILMWRLRTQPRTIELNCCTRVRKSALASIGRSCPNLDILSLNNCRQVNNKVVRTILMEAASINCLRLTNIFGLSDSAFNTIAAAPHCLSNLKELSLSFCTQITSDVVKRLSEACLFLETVDLSYCRRVGDTAVTKLLQDASHLNNLNISFCEAVTDRAFVDLPWASAMKTDHKPRHGKLRELAVGGTQIGDGTLEAVSLATPNLQKLDLRWCQNVTDYGLSVVSNQCPFLDYLSVRACPRITPALFPRLLSQLPYLSVLDVAYCSAVSPASLALTLAFKLPLVVPVVKYQPEPSFPMLEVLNLSFVACSFTSDHKRRANSSQTSRHSSKSNRSVSAGRYPSTRPARRMSSRRRESKDVTEVEDQRETTFYPMTRPPGVLNSEEGEGVLMELALAKEARLAKHKRHLEHSVSSEYVLPAYCTSLDQVARTLEPTDLRGIDLMVKALSPNLRSLSLDGLYGAANFSVLNNLQHCAHLEELGIAFARCTPNEIDCWQEVCSACKNVTQLRVDFSGVDATTQARLAQPLSTAFPELECVEVRGSDGGGGLTDTLLRTLLSNRCFGGTCKLLKGVWLYNCASLSEKIFNDHVWWLDRLYLTPSLMLVNAPLLTDASIIMLLGAVPKLQNFSIYDAIQLTNRSMRSLIACCDALRFAQFVSTTYRKRLEK
eukprot:Platyproteum_vivax@DN6146_c0_g1_i1.p1